MQNGTYLIQHKALKTSFKLVACNGKLKLLNGKYSRFIAEDKLQEMYDVREKLKPTETLWNIKYFLNGKEREHIEVNGSYAICVHKIKELKRLKGYQNGLLKPSRV